MQNDQQQLILSSMLENVPSDGWSEQTLHSTINTLKLDKNEVAQSFPGGHWDIYRRWNSHLDERMTQALVAASIDKMRMQDRIRKAVQTRLQLMEDQKEAIRKASNVQWSMSRFKGTFGAFWRTADAMWKSCGDKTVGGFDYYSKRTLLMMVYTQSCKVWLEDKTPDYSATTKATDIYIQRVMKIQIAKFKLTQMFKKKPPPKAKP